MGLREGRALNTLDSATLVAAGDGNHAAMRVLYNTYAPAVCGFLRLRGASDPEGLTNDVFINVLPRLRTIEGGEPGFRTLLFSIAHARLVDSRRRQSRQLSSVPFTPESDERLVPSAEAEAVQRLTGEATLRALDALTDDQRAVVVMRVLADLSIKETARALGKSEPAVKKIQAKALSSLRRALEGRPLLVAI